jgi:hypothetical protein
MPALVAGIHVLLPWRHFLGDQGVDGRVKPGHDGHYVQPRSRNYSPNTALVMMLRWISLEPP